ncbi:MAG: amidohydrolase family protein, partial [Jiangellaceae bacterium]
MSARADLVLTGGQVYTVDAAARWAQAVAVAGGRIVAVGSDAAVRPWIGPSTDVVELRGRMVLPGFQDAHAHPVFAGLEMLACNLAELSTRREYLDAIQNYAAARPESSWITGGGWKMSAFPGGTPTAADLDTIVADRPVYLPNRDHHGAWVNTAALALAGITADTPDPADGRIERDA